MPENQTLLRLAGDVATVSARLEAHLQSCEAANIVAANALQRLADKVEGFEKLPARGLAWFIGVIAVASITILGQNFFLHQDTTAKAAQAATAATQAEAGQQVESHKLDTLIAHATNGTLPAGN